MVNPIIQTETLATTGGTLTLDISRAEAVVIINGTGTLSGAWSIVASATPVVNTTIAVDYRATFNSTSFGFSILGYALSETETMHSAIYQCVYTGSAWQVIAQPDFNSANTGFLDATVLKANSLGANQISDSSISNAKLALARIGSVKATDNAGVVTDIEPTTAGDIPIFDGTTTEFYAISGDATLDGSGGLTIGNNKITNAKLATMARGTVKVGVFGDTASDLDASTDGAILIGDGDDVNSAVLFGDISLRNDGLTTLSNSVVNDAKITYYKDGRNVYRAVPASYVIQDGELKAYLNGTTQSLVALKTGDMILSCRLYISTASGTGTDRISIGVDNTVRTAGAVTDGFIKDVNANSAGIYASTSASGFSTYVGSLGKIGYQVADGNGYITITSNANMTASPLVCTLVIEVLPS